MTQCHLVQDLLVPYLASDVSPQTRDWVNEHLEGCAHCRARAEEMAAPMAALSAGPAVPSAEPGRRLMRRLGRQVTILVGAVAVLALLALGFGFVILKMTDLPVNAPPVPPASQTPASVAKTDTALLGLTAWETRATSHGVTVVYRTRSGSAAEVTYEQFGSPQEAGQAFREWNSSFRTRSMSAATMRPSWSSAKFRSGGVLYHAWQNDRWMITIEIPETTADAGQLRSDLHDTLLTVFRYME